MGQIDPKLTGLLQKWLDTPRERRDIRAGADLMLRLNRNRALYNSIMRRPDSLHDKLEYELKKYLRIRLDNHTLEQVAAIEKKTMPSAAEIVENPPVLSSDDELPVGTHATGRRADHDSLPDNVKALFDENFDVYKTVKHLFEECKAMNHLKPCDRYDTVQRLAAADERYRRNLEKYDAYRPEPSEVSESGTAEEDEAEALARSRRIGAARKTLSKYKKIAQSETDAARRAEAIDKMQAAVNVLVSCNAVFTEEYRAELVSLGIDFDSDNAETDVKNND